MVFQCARRVSALVARPPHRLDCPFQELPEQVQRRLIRQVFSSDRPVQPPGRDASLQTLGRSIPLAPVDVEANVRASDTPT